MKGQEIIDTFAVGHVEELDLEIAAAQVFIKASEKNEILVEAKNLTESNYICELREKKLVICYKFWGMKRISNLDMEKQWITIYLPEKKALSYVNMVIGAGAVLVEKNVLFCEKMDLEVGAGKWESGQLWVSDKLGIKLGAGKIKLEDTKAGNLVINCGVGKCTYEGRVERDMKVSCGMGNCEIDLENRESDFEYDTSNGMGSISINGQCVKKQYGNRKTLGSAVLECGLGIIKVTTN